MWQLSTADEKSIPAVKINILRDMTVSIPYLVPTQFQELMLWVKGSGLVRCKFCIYDITVATW